MLEFETAATMKDSWARPCDACRSAASTVYCRTDLAYLCSPCDVRIHPASLHDHDRVWVCESCERAPAAFLCKADSASLCAACDADIHSANPLARRHLRVPVQPIPTSLYCPSNLGGDMMTPELADDEDEDAWLLLNPMKNGSDEYLDLDEYNQLSEGYSCNNQQQHSGVPESSYGGDSIVPIKYEEGNNCFQLGYNSTITYHPHPSISQTVGIVPESENEASMMSQSYTSTRGPKGTTDLFSSPCPCPSVNQAAPTQLSSMDREARVMRYREKKKTRKFEKTIRYASRKAYAETRPRIKGRFAKRRGQLQVDDDQIFSSQSLVSSHAAYGVVPSF